SALAIARGGEPNRPYEPDADRIKIEFRRLQAISNVLSFSIPKSSNTLQMHLVWAGDSAMCALSDDMLASLFMWPNSLPPDEVIADEATTLACDAVAQSHLISRPRV
ncbi:MAG: hypothetical protein ACKPKO_11180, partial [Candidatus Fonsibacter sp.]